ncbi:MAG: GW dipeptide domain-containing protein [Cyclobacteriaceae bacterium]|jgi:hypothetical protein
MKTRTFNIWISALVFLLIISCHPKPKLYEANMADGSEAAGNAHDDTEAPAMAGSHSGGHNVVVEEVLNTEKYSYLNVTENGEKFWIAIPRMEVEIGGTYHYTDALLKHNFESKEYDRVFETIYLVSDIHAHSDESGASTPHGGEDPGTQSQGAIDVEPAEGSIQLTELFSNKEKYKDQTVQVTGKCVKVNKMIMGRNWVHIQDGSGDGLDLTITTTENVQLNEVVTFEGVIALNKDFGAGYKYDIILEQGKLKATQTRL